jgi:NADH-quinone oxidoreductase subunit F
MIRVCDDIGCKCRGADQLIEALEHAFGPPVEASESLETHVTSGAVGWTRSPCLGMCDRAPAALITEAGAHPHEHQVGRATVERLRRVLDGHPSETTPTPAIPPQDARGLRLLRRVGHVDPARLDDYLAAGGYDALSKAFSIGPEAVIEEVIASKLAGRGGAAFPTGLKWKAVASQASAPHYLICNADESEPGTFKDRILMEHDPFAIVEAMTIAAFATGCEKGFVYVRGEYPCAASRMKHAIEEARARRLLGDDILGRGFAFDVEIRRGGGAYICGEETALFESIEGRRAQPRSKPPFPTDVGLFGKPTVVNNVETLVNVPLIVLEGAAAWAAVGTTQSTGTRLFCLSGHVRRPGAYEAPYGVRVRTLIDMAGGLAAGRSLRAVLLGGAAGAFIGPDDIDLKLTHEDTKAASATIGSGVVLVIDDSVDLGDIVRRIAAFFRSESCGRCVPCRLGTLRQEEALNRIAYGCPRGGLRTELTLIDDVGAVLRDASICGLGQTAHAAIASAVHRLRIFDEKGAVR